MTKYNGQLTNANGYRFVYVEAAPITPIMRSVKIDPEWIKIIYDGQGPGA